LIKSEPFNVDGVALT